MFWRNSQRKDSKRISHLVKVSVAYYKELSKIKIPEFLLRVDDNIAQTDDDQVLLNLQFLKKELETFVDGFEYKGFYFPVKYALNA